MGGWVRKKPSAKLAICFRVGERREWGIIQKFYLCKLTYPLSISVSVANVHVCMCMHVCVHVPQCVTVHACEQHVLSMYFLQNYCHYYRLAIHA